MSGKFPIVKIPIIDGYSYKLGLSSLSVYVVAVLYYVDAVMGS